MTMYVIKKLRLNHFKSSPIVSSRRLFEMFGLSEPKIQSSQTAEDPTQVIPFGARKVQQLELATEMAQKAAEFAVSPSNTEPMKEVKPREK